MTPGIVRQLRDLVPIRPLSREEALRVAELQANRFLAIAGVTHGPVSDTLITELPRVEVLRKTPWPVSGATDWVSGRWVIVLNAAEPGTRQRFSLAHEFKHIVDHPFIDHLYRGVAEASRGPWTEQVCDYFAACLLMPRPWVKRAYTTGLQSLPDLAAAFGVSQAAMTVRLNQIGLTGPTPRCDRSTREWILAAVASTSRYKRIATPMPAT